jgi:hypothetical protein
VRRAAPVPCPFCGSDETEKQGDFGTSLMVRLHFCRACHTAFEAIKWGDGDGLDLPEFIASEREQDGTSEGEAGSRKSAE